MGFIKAQGCEATAEELTAFLKERQSGEVSDAELDNVAGGTCNQIAGAEAMLSVVSFALGCIGITLKSALEDHVGQQSDQEARMCTPEEKPNSNGNKGGYNHEIPQCL